MGAPPTLTMSRGRRIDLSGPHYYQDLLTGIAMEILNELSELEKLDLKEIGEDAMDQVVSITQIRLLNELYYGLGATAGSGDGIGRETGHPRPAGYLEPLHRQHQPAGGPEIPGGAGRGASAVISGQGPVKKD